MSRTTFVVRHYCADVIYEVNGFLEANRARVSTDVCLLLSESRNAMAAALLPFLSGSEGRLVGGGSGSRVRFQIIRNART